MNGNSDQIRGKLGTKIVNTMLAIILVLGLSPLSKASASVVNDSAQQSAEQARQVAAESAGDASDSSANAGANASDAAADNATSGSANASSDANEPASGADDASTSASTPENASANSVTGGGASGAVTENGKAAAAATQNSNESVAVQSDEYNPNAAPIMIGSNVTANDMSVSAGLYSDEDCTNPLGDTPVSSSDLVYGKINIKFDKTIKPSKSQPNIEYVFPDSIKDVHGITGADSGTKYEGGKIIYTWKIENGILKINFAEIFFDMQNSEIYANADFDFKINADKVNDDGKLDIVFPGSGTALTINQKEGNVSGNKSWKLNDDGKSITFTVDLDAETNVTDFVLSDVMGSNLTFDPFSFRLDGESVSADVDRDTNTATIKKDKLSKGKHTLTYTATINDNALAGFQPGSNGNASLSDVGNTATWTWKGKPEGDSSNVTPDINYNLVSSKSASDEGEGIYEWSVDINSGNAKADMKGYTFTDKLDNPDALEYVGSYVVIDVTDGDKQIASGAIDTSKDSFKYVFDNNAQNHQYKIVYSTKVKDGVSYGTYKNTARVDDGKGNSGSKDGSIEVKPSNGADVEKEIISSVDDEGYVTWKSTIKLSELSSGCDITKAWFVDTPGFEWNEGANTKDDIWFVDDAGLQLSTVDGKQLALGTDYVVSWVNSQNYGQGASESEAKNWGFKITFTEACQGFVGKNDIVLTYKTQCSNKVGTYKNTAKFNDGYGHETSDSKSYEIATEDSTSKNGSLKWDSDFDWSLIDSSDATKGAWVANWTVTANYENSQKTSYGRYGLVDTNGNPIDVEDDLAGMTYVPGSGKYTVMANYGNDANGEKCKADGDLNAQIENGILKASIPTVDVFDGKGEGTHFVYATATYETVSKYDSSLLKGESSCKVSFTNHVSAKSGSHDLGGAEKTVEGKQSVVDKTGNLDQKQNLASYVVAVNDQAQDLVPGSDTVTLTDTLTGKAELITDEIYVTDSKGNRLGSNEYYYSIKQGIDSQGNPTTTLTFTLPDSQALKVYYKALAVGQINETGVLSNNARLSGKRDYDSSSTLSYTIAKSVVNAGGVSTSISITKKDGTSVNTNLEDAEFSLYKVADIDALHSSDPSAIKAAGALVDTQTTDSSGKLTFGATDALETATLYFFEETNAPIGYEQDNSITCFVLKGNDDNAFDAISKKLSGKSIPFYTIASYTRYNTPSSRAYAEFLAKKTIEGDAKSLTDGEFTFEAEDSKGNVVASGTNDINGDIKISGEGLSWDAAGTYEYTISEKSGNEEGITYSGKTYKAIVTVSRASEYAPLKASVAYKNADGSDLGSDEIPSFVNNYTAPVVSPTSAAPTLQKTVTGTSADWAMPADAFSFTLTQKSAPEGAVANENQIKANSASADSVTSISFDNLVFNKEGIYVFELAENSVDASMAPGVTKDSTVYTVTYVVDKKSDANELEVKSVNAKPDKEDDNHQESQSDQGIKFVNSYSASPVFVNLAAKKVLNNATLTDGQFSFTLKQTGAPEGIAFASGQTKANDAEGNVTFDAIEYDKVGTYEYEIAEVVPDDAANGVKDNIAYDSIKHTAKVVVADDGKGQLHASVKYDTDKTEVPTFANTYTKPAPAATSFTAQVKKQLDGGRDLKDQEFEFVLKKGDKEIAHVKNAADGTVTFKGIAINSVSDGGEYTISEVKGSDDSIDYSNEVVKVNVDVTETDGKLNASVTYGENKTTDIKTITNTFKPAAVSVTVEASKELTGRDLKAGEFTFQLKEGDDLIAEAANDVNGKIVFPADKLTFDAPCEHDYTISEVAKTGDDAKGVAYDSTVRKAHVSVTQDKETGALKAEVSYPDGGDKAFENTYTAKGASVSLSASKTLTGKALADKQFSFQVKENGEVVAEAANDTDGEVTFPEIEYAETGDHDYTIFEVVPDGGVADGVTYDQSVYKVHVSVKDNGEGQLVPEVTYRNAEGEAIGSGDVKFNNSYKETKSIAVLLGARKTLDGNAPTADQKFAFDLNKMNPDGSKGDLVSTAENNEGEVAFGGLTYSDAADEWYLISEQSKDGYNCDAKTVKVHVVVNKGADNQLTPQVTYVDGESESNEVPTFANTTKLADGQAAIAVSKTVNGLSNVKEDTSFQFQLFAADENGNAVGDQIGKTVEVKAGGTVSFDPITYSEDDIGKTFSYVVHEIVPSGDGWAAHADVPVSVTVSKDAESNKVAASVNYGQNESSVAFDNAYTAQSVSADLKLKKTVNGGALKDGEQFSFQLLDAGKNPFDGKTATVSASNNEATVCTPEITDQMMDGANEKTFTYFIHETSNLGDGWTNADDVEVNVKIVRDSETLDLKVDSIKYVNNGDGAATDKALFDNAHADKKAEAVLKVSKTVNGTTDDGLQKQFEFQLQPKDDAPMPEGDTVTVTGTSSAAFGGISYDKVGTYDYVIHESSEPGAGWTNASDVNATVEVGYADNGRDLVVKSIKYNNQQVDAAVFDNKYEEPKQPDNPKGETPEQPQRPSGDTPNGGTPSSDNQPLAADGAKSSGVKTGDSLMLIGGGIAVVAVVAAAVAAITLRRRKN